MVLAKSILWIVRIIVITIFIALVTIMAASVNEERIDTSYIQFEQVFRVSMNELIRDDGSLRMAVFEDPSYFDDRFDFSRIAFRFTATIDGEVKEVTYDENYYNSRIGFRLSSNYEVVEGLIPVQYGEDVLFVEYSYVFVR